MYDYLFTVCWVLLWSMPSFLIQLLICFKIKNRFIRFIPWFISVAGFMYSIDGMFNITGLITGAWHELGAFIICCYTGIYTLGLLLAWIVYKIYKKKKR